MLLEQVTQLHWLEVLRNCRFQCRSGLVGIGLIRGAEGNERRVGGYGEFPRGWGLMDDYWETKTRMSRFVVMDRRGRTLNAPDLRSLECRLQTIRWIIRCIDSISSSL